MALIFNTKEQKERNTPLTAQSLDYLERDTTDYFSMTLILNYYCLTKTVPVHDAVGLEPDLSTTV